ncbi:MAG: S26 family signal peptidase [Bacteroidales bacterium]|nr:S26 family signal peptidase [Bacteroidales bacterium]
MGDIQKTNSSVNWDRFVIKGESMEPTLHTGEGVWVNKLLMGARIYTKFDFEDSRELHCFRMPGLRKLRVGDVAVFNYPYGRGGDTIAFKINYVYCKRCWGRRGTRCESWTGGWRQRQRRPWSVNN